MSDHDRTQHLLREWHAGSQRALGELIERDRHWIFDYLRRRRGPALQRDAETIDHFQDLMVEVLNYAPRFVVANLPQFRRLVATMIDNLLVDRARHVARRAPAGAALEPWPSDGQLALDPSFAAATAPDDAAARAEELSWLRLGMEFLGDDERQLVRRHKLEGKSFVELGSDLDADPNTVRMRCHRALLRLAGVVQRLQCGQIDALLAEREAG